MPQSILRSTKRENNHQFKPQTKELLTLRVMEDDAEGLGLDLGLYREDVAAGEVRAASGDGSRSKVKRAHVTFDGRTDGNHAIVATKNTLVACLENRGYRDDNEHPVANLVTLGQFEFCRDRAWAPIVKWQCPPDSKGLRWPRS